MAAEVIATKGVGNPNSGAAWDYRHLSSFGHCFFQNHAYGNSRAAFRQSLILSIVAAESEPTVR